MNEKTNYYKNLHDYFEQTKFDENLIAILKMAILTISGGLVGFGFRMIETDNDYRYLIVGGLIFCIAAFLEYRRLQRRKTFPLSLLTGLTNQDKLEEQNALLNRKLSIDSFIEESIKELNGSTCSIDYENNDTGLCSEDLKQGLSRVLASLISRPNNILDVDYSKFTIVVYLNFVFSGFESSPYSGQQPKWLRQHFIMRDDLDLGGWLYGNVFDLNGKGTESLVIQARNASTINDSKFNCEIVELFDNKHTIITAPIPQVCEGEGSNGALCFIMDSDIPTATDLENILLIFGRIVANWINKYNTCAIARANSEIEDPLSQQRIDAPVLEDKPFDPPERNSPEV